MKKSSNTLPGFVLLAEDPDDPKPVLFEVTEDNRAALRSLIADLQGETVEGSRGRRGRRGERGPVPDHEATQSEGGYKIRFQLPNGGWGEPLEALQGLPGVPGESVQGPRGEPGESIEGRQGRQGDSVKGDKGDIGPMPRHEWKGTRLRFELPGGKFGPLVNLQGPPGMGGGGRGRSANQGFDSISLNGTDLVFSRAGAGPLGQTITVDLSSLGGGGTGDESLTYFLGE